MRSKNPFLLPYDRNLNPTKRILERILFFLHLCSSLPPFNPPPPPGRGENDMGETCIPRSDETRRILTRNQGAIRVQDSTWIHAKPSLLSFFLSFFLFLLFRVRTCLQERHAKQRSTIDVDSLRFFFFSWPCGVTSEPTQVDRHRPGVSVRRVKLVRMRAVLTRACAPPELGTA